MPTFIDTPPQSSRQTFDDPLKWIDAWSRARQAGAETLLLDRAGDVLSVFILSNQGIVTTLCWNLGIVPEGTSYRPSNHGIEETLGSEILLGNTWQDPSWTPSALATVRGKGVFMYPLGPVHADVAECILYQLNVMGDDIIHLNLQNGFKHRHIRDLVKGQTMENALPIIERFTTTSNVHHTVAMTLAIEQAWNVTCSNEVNMTRQLLLELERAYSHLGDLALLAVSTGLSVPQMEYLHLKEQLLRVNNSLFGHRYLRGSIQPGGLNTTLWPSDANTQIADETVTAVLDAADAIQRDLERTPSFLDRLHGAGIIPHEVVHQARPVGPMGRACGLEMDVRTWLPYCHYDRLSFKVPTALTSDAYARFRVRVDELEESLNVVRRLLGGWHPGPLKNLPNTYEMFRSPPMRTEGLGVVEAPRGLLCYRVIFNPKTAHIAHIGVATPSQRNWTVVPSAMANNNILQDFPIIDASFSLSVAGWDG